MERSPVRRASWHLQIDAGRRRSPSACTEAVFFKRTRSAGSLPSTLAAPDAAFASSQAGPCAPPPDSAHVRQHASPASPFQLARKHIAVTHLILFFSISEHADGERRRPVSIGRHPKDACHRGPFRTLPLRFGPAPGARRRQCAAKTLKIDPRRRRRSSLRASTPPPRTYPSQAPPCPSCPCSRRERGLGFSRIGAFLISERADGERRGGRADGKLPNDAGA